MADTKTSALTALTGANVDTAADVLPIVDTSVTTTKKILIDQLRIALLSQTGVTNALGSDVALNNTGSFFTGPTCAQGTSGVWFASGSVTVTDTASASTFNIKLWDGTTVIAATQATIGGASQQICVHLAGYLDTPADNIRISVQDLTSTSGKIQFNQSGTSKDSILFVFRIG